MRIRDRAPERSMSEQSPLPEAIRRKLVWPVRLTWAGMIAERITRAFWPVWTLCFGAIAALGFGFQDWAPLELFWAGCLGVPLGLLWAFGRGWRRFHWPSQTEALARLDQTLAGRPLATLSDTQALGGADEGSKAVWQAHLARLAARVGLARSVAPDLRISARDPYALRYAALTAVLMALMFGSLWRGVEFGDPAAGQATASVAASWEGWAEPPARTGRPGVYLNSVTAGQLALPQGSRIVLRIYGPSEALALRETVSQTPAIPTTPAAGGQSATTDQRSHDFIAMQSGTLAIDGAGGREWAVTVVPDMAPTVALAGPMKRQADGTMSQPFKAHDDYAVARGVVRFDLDVAALDRRFGLAANPDPQEALVFDLPLPITGNRGDFSGTLVEDASDHPWAHLPVKMALTVTDGAGQTGMTEAKSVTLPGRRFFDPLAAAVIEMRRDLLWSRANAPRVSQILRAVTHRPEGFIRNERAYLMLRVAIRRLDAGLQPGPVSPALRDELSAALWEVALLIEDGGLEDALERMRQAQERLSEAIRNGASPEEIQKLMDDLREASDDYLRMLAEKGEQDPADRFTEDQPRQSITEDQIQSMMDEIQKLMEEGRMAEAQALLEQLNQLMENLKVTQGEGGKGQDGKGGKAMKDLRQTLRDQQELSDDAFRQGQQQNGMGGANTPRDRRPGQDQRPPHADGDAGEQGKGENGDPGRSLAERQKALREGLGRQQGALPDAQGQDADTARRALDEAGRAMQEAERALRDGDMPDAIERQAEAIEKLREGLRGLNEALAQDQNRLPGPDGQAQGDPGRALPRDPLGRADGTSGQSGTDQSMLQGEDVYRRARDLLDDLRKRSSDLSRPAIELDYLKRLLDRF